MKRVVFKAHSPFTIFISAIIGEQSYCNDYKILVMGNPIDSGFADRVIKSGLFQQVICIDQRKKTLVQIEKDMCYLFEKLGHIDEYFMCVFSDGYSIAIAHRLYMKSVLNIFPEGCSTLHLNERIDLLYNEIYGKDEELREIYDRYPIKLEMFDNTWIYGKSMEQGLSGIHIKNIDVQFVLNKPRAKSFSKQLNQLYGYVPSGRYDIYFLDDGLVGLDRLDLVAEKQIFDNFFHLIKNKRIMVKAHPGDDLSQVLYRFKDYNVEIFDKVDVPWELLLFNALSNKRENIKIISSILSTPIMSVMNFCYPHQARILSLQELEKPYYSEFIRKSIELNGRYYLDMANSLELPIFIPDNIHDLPICINEFLEENNHSEVVSELSSAMPARDFCIVGNLLAKSVIYADNGNFFKEEWFEYGGTTSKITYDIDCNVSYGKLIWNPSVKNLFSSIRCLKVELEIKGGKRIVLIEEDGYIFLEKGRLSFDLNYEGYCKCILIEVSCVLDMTLRKSSESYGESKWKINFWKNWCNISQTGLLYDFLRGKDINLVWIYGCSEIGKTIGNAIKKANVEITYIVSGIMDEINEVISTEKVAYKSDVEPDIMIITAMNHYDSVFFRVPCKIKRKTFDLNTFINEILNYASSTRGC